MELDTPARRVLAIRLKALSDGDAALVRECEWQLARWGVTLEETERAVIAPERVEKAVTEKREVKPKVKVLSEVPAK